MKAETGPDATYITAIAITTAPIMISISLAMPIAVMIEFERKDQVDHDQLRNHQGKRLHRHVLSAIGLAMLDFGVDFVRRLRDQEHAAADQDDVAPGNPDAEDREQRIGQLHQPGQAEQHRDAKDEGEREADLPRPKRLIGRAARHQDGNEDDVVDAQHDLEHGQSGQRRPGLGICEQFEHGGLFRIAARRQQPDQHEIDGNQA